MANAWIVPTYRKDHKNTSVGTGFSKNKYAIADPYIPIKDWWWMISGIDEVQLLVVAIPYDQKNVVKSTTNETKNKISSLDVL